MHTHKLEVKRTNFNSRHSLTHFYFMLTTGKYLKLVNLRNLKEFTINGNKAKFNGFKKNVSGKRDLGKS